MMNMTDPYDIRQIEVIEFVNAYSQYPMEWEFARDTGKYSPQRLRFFCPLMQSNDVLKEMCVNFTPAVDFNFTQERF